LIPPLINWSSFYFPTVFCIDLQSFFDRRDLKFDDIEYTRVDATVAERLSASPLIYDIYGHCGIGIMSEYFPYGDMEKISIDYDNYPEQETIWANLKKEELVVYNDIKPFEKLKAALNMAQAIATLHGFEHGVIVHQVSISSLFLQIVYGVRSHVSTYQTVKALITFIQYVHPFLQDVQMSQFLLNEDKTKVKLNDFNRAEFMLWDEEKGQYCAYSPGTAHGNVRFHVNLTPLHNQVA
jgi:hypothetical protein